MSTTPLRFRPVFHYSLKFVIAACALTTAKAAELPRERIADDVLTLQVQNAIAEDPTLKPHHLNLLVNMIDGMAVIGGEVPDLKLIPHIEKAVRGVAGVRSVKVSGWLPAGNKLDKFGEKVAEQMVPAKPPMPETVKPLSPPVEPPPAPPLSISAPKTAPQLKPLPPDAMFLDPIASTSTSKSGVSPGAAPLPYPTIPPPGVPTQPILVPETGWQPVVPAPTRQAWEEVRKLDPRFAGMEVLRNGRAYTITGRAAKLTDAWDFAEELQKMPGVETVVVGRVLVK
jgi:hypothetical protein